MRPDAPAGTRRATARSIRACRSGCLAEPRDHPPAPVDVRPVEAAQFAAPDPGGVEQFEDEPVAQFYRFVAGRRGDQRGGLVVAQDGGQLTVRLRAGEPRTRVALGEA